MAQPTAYAPATDFSDEEASSVGGRSTVRTAALDAELSAIQTTLQGVLTNLALIQRDDGDIRDGEVKLHTLGADVRALLAIGNVEASNLRGAWLTATVYVPLDVVTQSANTYIATTMHTSGTFATDLAAGRWILLSLGTSIGAAAVSFTPTATLAATNVQAALEETDTENRALSAAASAAISALESDLADTGTVAKGDAKIGVKRTESGAEAQTLHLWIQRSKYRLTDALTTSEVDDILSKTASIDVASKLQTALASAAGKTLLLPEGHLRLASAVSLTGGDTWVEGCGRATRLVSASTTADIFTIGDGTNEISGLVFSDFDVWASVTKTAGYAFNARFTTDSEWRGVRVGSNDLYSASSGHRLFRGWYFDRFDTVSIHGGQCVTPDDGVRARGNADDTYSAEMVLDGNLRFFRQNATGAAAVRIGGNCGGVYLRRMDASLCTYGLVIDTTLSLAGSTATKRNREVFVEGANFDSCKKWGIYQVAESVAVLIMDKPWAAACGTDDDGSGGIFIGGGTTVLPFVVIGGSPFIYNNVGPGVRLEGGLVSIDGGQIALNGRSASGGHGIEFGSTLPVRFSVSGTDIAYNGTASKGYGIKVDAALDQFAIVGSSFYSNGQGAIDNAAGFGPTKVIRSCPGYVTENSGVASITSGNTSATIAHGLSATVATVQLTPIGAPEDTDYNAGNFGATNFDINVGATTTTTRQFSWRASVTGQ